MVFEMAISMVEGPADVQLTNSGGKETVDRKGCFEDHMINRSKLRKGPPLVVEQIGFRTVPRNPAYPLSRDGARCGQKFQLFYFFQPGNGQMGLARADSDGQTGRN